MTTLAQRLRQDCNNAHRQIEQHPFIQKLFAGSCSGEAYARYLARLAPLYQALEGGLQALPSASPYRALCLPPLYRSTALAADLQLMGQSAAAAEEVPLAAYLSASDQPQRLAAGFYVRYLGDLGGGQILARVLQRSLGLTPEAGLAFYHYAQVSVDQGREQAKAALATLGEQVAHEPIIEAAQTVFALHQSVFPTV